MTFRYCFGPAVLSAAAELPELCPYERSEPASLAIAVADRIEARNVAWYHEWRFPDGRLWMRMGRVHDGHVLRFPQLADFAIREGGTRLDVAAYEGILTATVRHLLLDQAVPLALSRQGAAVLHAAAVGGPAGAVAFAGPSGSGKSTLTAALAARGGRALSDDTLLLTESGGRIAAHVPYPSLRLWPDAAAAVLGGPPRAATRVCHYNEKLRVGRASLTFEEQQATLRAVYLLMPDESVDRPVVQALEGRERIVELLRHAFVLEDRDAFTARTRFETFARIAASVSVSRLRFPHRYDQIGEIQRLVTDC